MSRYYITNGKRTFWVEPIDPFNRGADWGQTDLSNRPQGGGIHPDESIIREENGFKNIQILPPGVSPDSVVSELLSNE